MAAKVVSLSVHRNTVEGRRKRTLATELRRNVEKMVRDEDIRAYAVIGIGSDGQACVMWDTGAILPMWAFADTMAAVLRQDVLSSGIEDDWCPPITVKP